MIVLAVAVVVSAAVGVAVGFALHHGSSPTSSVSPTSTPTSAPSNRAAGLRVSAIAAAVDPAVVDITTTVSEGAAAGTGMVLTATGLVLTDNHVIEGATAIHARIDGVGPTYTATVVGYSIADDVALLQLRGVAGLRTVTTGTSSSLAVGSGVVAIGNAGGKGGTPRVVTGTVTALDQTITAGGEGLLTETLHHMIEIDAPIVPGDSGGPLLDSSGRVIGMDAAAAEDVTGLGGRSATGQAYAIGIDQALVVVDQIRAGQASATVQIGPRALLGVEVVDLAMASGAYVEAVQAGSPAALAGILPGDAIVSVGNSAISSATDLSEVLAGCKPGQTVTVGWVDPTGAGHRSSVRLITGPPA